MPYTPIHFHCPYKIIWTACLVYNAALELEPPTYLTSFSSLLTFTYFNPAILVSLLFLILPSLFMIQDPCKLIFHPYIILFTNIIVWLFLSITRVLSPNLNSLEMLFLIKKSKAVPLFYCLWSTLCCFLVLTCVLYLELKPRRAGIFSFCLASTT